MQRVSGGIKGGASGGVAERLEALPRIFLKRG